MPKSHESALNGRISHMQTVCYALPVVGVYFLMGPITILQGIYAKYFGLSLGSIALVLLISRIFDAVTDPVIGFYTDKYYTNKGTRKPFVVVGGLLLVLSSYFLYMPPVDVTFSYFLGWCLIFYLGFTLFEIPHLAWGGGLAEDSIDKNKIFGLRTFLVFTGSLVFFAVPLLPIFKTNEFTPETLKWSALMAILLLPMLYINAKKTPDKNQTDNARHAAMPHKSPEKFSSLWKVILKNKPFVILTAAHICTGISSGMLFGLLFILVDVYLGLGHKFAIVYVISFGSGALSLALWYNLAARKSKQLTWALGMIAVVVGLIGISLLSQPNFSWVFLLISMLLINCGFASFGIMVPSLLSDIIDYGTLKSSVDYSCSYFSLYTLINKTVGAAGGALSLAIASRYGFDPTTSIHGQKAVYGLFLGVAWLPIAFTLLSIVCIALIPISPRQHAIIRRRLDCRAITSNGIH